MVMRKFTNILNRRPSHDDEPIPDGDSPEAVAGRAVRLFCESGGPNNATEEIQCLPDIVTSAESSPAAAAVAASQIREFLSKKHYNRPHVQYNAVMLIRILADNPGATFTRNIDKKFVETVKELLRNGRDPSVAQIVRETLSAMYREKAYDNNLGALFQMWNKEQGQYQPRYTNGHPPGPRNLVAPPWSPAQNMPIYEGQGSYGNASQSSSRGIPPPAELAGRIEEARTSAKLLLQLIQSTPPNELLSNDLIKEFAERCQSAQRSIQGYINCDDPPPDHDTMQTLIETSEQLGLAMSKHQRAVLNARRQADPTSPPSNPTPPPSGYYTNPPGPTPTNYNPPVGPPPTTYSRPNSSPSTAYPPTTGPLPSTFSPSTTTFSPPPGPPPSLQANLQRRMDPLPQPPHATISSEPVELPSAGPGERHENPFSDSHAQSYDTELPAPAQPMGTPPPLPPPRQGQEERHIPASLQAGAGRQGVGGSSGSYHPGYSSTPSYLHRQESAGEHLTMSGGGAASPEQGGDVSPVESRTVTYRY